MLVRPKVLPLVHQVRPNLNPQSPKCPKKLTGSTRISFPSLSLSNRSPPRSQEDIQHAWSVNAWRSSCSLPNKSVGSVSTSQRRSAAYQAAQSSTPADSIGERWLLRRRRLPDAPNLQRMVRFSHQQIGLALHLSAMSQGRKLHGRGE